MAEKIPDYAEYDAIIKKRDKLFAKITNENESIKKELNLARFEHITEKQVYLIGDLMFLIGHIIYLYIFYQYC